MRAINHAHTILGWQENLPSEETPPEWMWSLDNELEEWFEQVEEARAEKYGRNNSRGNDDDTIVPLVQNELTRRRR
jgi:hypothetical protein